MLVSSPSYFECVPRQSSVCLDLIIVSPDNLGLVDDALLDNTAKVGERAVRVNFGVAVDEIL